MILNSREALKNGAHLVIFPEGYAHRKISARYLHGQYRA
jgi:hypothetical protein